ncbi:MAG: cytochrome c oxidase subunit 3 [Proteobacteria bacterium]|nr:cytochrome c oxidase subunit 3 [Pseudomonadota bacterium]
MAKHDHHEGNVYEDSGIPQPYHLVSPSVLPLLGAAAGGLLALGMVLFMHKVAIFSIPVGIKGILLGFACVGAVMVYWWRDVIHEAYVEKFHGPITRIGFRYGMALFICSEVMFFVAFFWAYFSSAIFPAGGIWPPKGIQTFNPFDMPFIMTLILLLSGCTVTFAHHALQEGRQSTAVKALGVTVGLGLLFTACQAFEYSHAAFAFNQGIFPSTFFMATGFHGAHVIIGTIFLTVCWWRTAQGQFTKDSHFGFEAAAWYWHFVDVVWLFLFTSIYWWGAGPQPPFHG